MVFHQMLFFYMTKKNRMKISPTYTLYQKASNPNKQYVVTVITPVYNGEKFIENTITSVIGQTIGFDRIEYILIDDCSTDCTKEILFRYANQYENIKIVSFDCNSGSPARPRNIGIELATSPYITFLDADDWLHPDGLRVLYEILEETGDPYVVGRTIKVENTKSQVIGEHQCCKERRSVSPLSIPHIFHHLGPTGRMMQTRFLREQQIRFPEMKFAEDKQFFIDVLIQCERISTTTKPIYYVNRLDETKHTRLTNQTNILQKTGYNLQVVYSILQRKVDREIEKMILNRLYEFDLLRRLFTTPHFQKTKLKWAYYYLFKQLLKPTKKLSYDIKENFINPFHRVVYELIMDGRYRVVTKLLEWERTEKVKEITVRNNQPCWVVPFLDEKYRFIPIPLYITFKHHYCEGNKYILQFQVCGEHELITDCLIRDGNDAHNECVIPVQINEHGEGFLEIPFETLYDLPTATYSIYIRYNDYMKTNIRQPQKSEMKQRFNEREFLFFHSPYANIALKIKE